MNYSFLIKFIIVIRTLNQLSIGKLLYLIFKLNHFQIFKPDLRSANRTSDRLGMKTAVERIVVIPGAIRAHGKIRHGRLRAVVRDILDNGEARTAIGAIDKWIAVPAIFWVE